MHLAIVGTGMMGSLIKDMAEVLPEIERIDTVEPVAGESLFDLPCPDVIIDFSHPDTLADICRYVRAGDGRTGVVFGTTGFTPEQLACIKALGDAAPVIQSYNYSYGIQTLKQLLGCAVPMLGGRADVEIIEKHHNLKVDAPSGTALALADSINEEFNNEYEYVYDRSARREKRPEKEIGISAVRGGTIVGDHDVIFAGADEVITFSHTAYSKAVFGKGAVQAAKFLAGKSAGMYNMGDVIDASM